MSKIRVNSISINNALDTCVKCITEMFDKTPTSVDWINLRAARNIGYEALEQYRERKEKENT